MYEREEKKKILNNKFHWIHERECAFQWPSLPPLDDDYNQSSCVVRFLSFSTFARTRTKKYFPDNSELIFFLRAERYLHTLKVACCFFRVRWQHRIMWALLLYGMLIGLVEWLKKKIITRAGLRRDERGESRGVLNQASRYEHNRKFMV